MDAGAAVALTPAEVVDLLNVGHTAAPVIRGQTAGVVTDLAWYRSVVAVIVARLRIAGFQPAIDDRLFQPFLAELRPMTRALRISAFTPSLARIELAARDAFAATVREPLIVDVTIGAHWQGLFNLGPNYLNLVGWQRLGALARMLGVDVDHVAHPRSQSRRLLGWALSGLPGRTGFVASIRADDEVIGPVHLEQLTGIEALGGEERRFLDRL